MITQSKALVKSQKFPDTSPPLLGVCNISCFSVYAALTKILLAFKWRNTLLLKTVLSTSKTHLKHKLAYHIYDKLSR
jgi:hypothetical protein